MTEDQNPAAIGVSIAASLIAQAARAGDTEEPQFWEAIDRTANGDHVREVLLALASMTAEFVRIIASLRGEPVDRVLDFVAGCVSESIAESEVD